MQTNRRRHERPLGRDERLALAKGDTVESVIAEPPMHFRLVCWCQRWDPLFPQGVKDIEAEIRRDRADCESYHPFEVTWSCQAAAEQRERIAFQREAEKDRELTRRQAKADRDFAAGQAEEDRKLTRRAIRIAIVTLGIALVTLIVSIIFDIINIVTRE